MAEEFNQEEANKEAVAILSNPENANKEEYKPLFEKAVELGMFKDGKFIPPVAETPAEGDDFLKSIKDRFGDYGSVDEFLTETEKWKLNAEANVNTFSSLPKPLFTAIQAHLANQDWRGVLKDTTLIDLGKSYSDKELLDVYFPNKFTPEELADTENLAVKKATTQAKTSFELDKQTEANNTKLNETRQKNQQRLVEESLNIGVQNFKKFVPTGSESQIARMKKELVNGKVTDLFYTPKGEIKEDALLNLFPLMFPDDFNKLKAAPIIDEANKQVEGIVNRGGAPKQFNRTAVSPDINKEKKDALGKAFGLESLKDPYKLTQVK